MRVLQSILAGLALASIPGASPALAASAYRQPPPKPKAAAPLRPLSGATRPAAQSRPALAGALAPVPAFGPSPGIAALGLEGMRLGPADAAPACRQACAVTRYQCGVEDPSCAGSWRQCLQGCSGLAVSQK